MAEFILLYRIYFGIIFHRTECIILSKNSKCVKDIQNKIHSSKNVAISTPFYVALKNDNEKVMANYFVYKFFI